MRRGRRGVSRARRGENLVDGKYEPYTQGKAPTPPTIFGTTDTVCTFDDMPDLYRAKRKNIEEGFAEYGATYTAHFSHWFPWG